MSWGCTQIRRLQAMVRDGVTPPFEWVIQYTSAGRVRGSLWRRCDDPIPLVRLALRAAANSVERRALRLAMVDYVALRVADPVFPWALLRKARAAPEGHAGLEDLLALRRRSPSESESLLLLFFEGLRGDPGDDVVFGARCVEVLRHYMLRRRGFHPSHEDGTSSRYRDAMNRAQNEASLMIARWVRRRVSPPLVGNLFS